MTSRDYLWTACVKGDLNAVKSLISKHDLDEECDYLYLAASYGQEEIAEFLIDYGVNVNSKSTQHRHDCALHAAVEGGHLNVVRILVQEGADVNVADNGYRGSTPLMLAAAYGQWEIVSFLTKHDPASVNTADNYGRTPLMLAAEHGHRETVLLLISNGAQVNVGESNGYTPLVLASIHKHWEIVTLLIQLGANTGRTLFNVVEMGRFDIIETLVLKGANVNVQDDNSVTPLMKAVEKGDVDTVSFLIRHGADVRLKDNRGRTALHFVQYRKTDIDKTVELLVKSGANIDEEDDGKQTDCTTGCPVIGFIL